MHPKTPMTTPPEFTPTPEQVEEAASAMLDSALGSAGAWQLVMEFTKEEYRKLAQWHLAELHRENEGLQSRLAAINHDNLLKCCRIADDSLKIQDLTAELSTLRSQLDRVQSNFDALDGLIGAIRSDCKAITEERDALKAQAVVKDEALKTALRQWSGYADEPRAMDEMYLDRAGDPEAKMYQDCCKALAQLSPK